MVDGAPIVVASDAAVVMGFFLDSMDGYSGCGVAVAEGICKIKAASNDATDVLVARDASVSEGEAVNVGTFCTAEETLIVAAWGVDGEFDGVTLSIESAAEGVLGSADGYPVAAEEEVFC